MKLLKHHKQIRQNKIQFDGYHVDQEEEILLYQLMQMINVDKNVTLLELIKMVTDYIQELTSTLATRLKSKASLL